MTHRMKLDPTTEQVAVLTRHCADARFVWNLGLEQRGFWRRGMRSLSYVGEAVGREASTTRKLASV